MSISGGAAAVDFKTNATVWAGRLFPIIFPLAVYKLFTMYGEEVSNDSDGFTWISVVVLLALSATTGIGGLWVEGRKESSIFWKTVFIAYFLFMFFTIPMSIMIIVLVFMGKVQLLTFAAAFILMGPAFRFRG